MVSVYIFSMRRQQAFFNVYLQIAQLCQIARNLTLSFCKQNTAYVLQMRFKKPSLLNITFSYRNAGFFEKKIKVILTENKNHIFWKMSFVI